MYDNCPSCNLKYLIEVGFYWGAMYVSYAISVAISIFLFLLNIMFINISITNYLKLNFAALLLLSPIIFRISRAIWIAIFVKYNPCDNEK
ncbi:DUF983 domain-containing protein [Ichthyobacterium seriolicida]|uniref:DUF983 domain-containing protein n=1 Tax=Ichthyobacterium seriolicida TaxID=242600 RepID=UPI0012FE393D|nr:DUF983 domain-containing protein [Ichthyobacterium seriolicida]